MKTYTIKTYEFNELSEEAKENAINYVRNNWHDLGQHIVDDVIESLKALEKEIGGRLDYSISIVPDRGEFITLKDYDKVRLVDLNKKKDDLPLTGVCWDYDVIDALMNEDLEEVLNIIHREGEYIYSDEGIQEMLDVNDYEFTEDGRFYN